MNQISLLVTNIAALLAVLGLAGLVLFIAILAKLRLGGIKKVSSIK